MIENVVFIDYRVADYESLIADLGAETKSYILGENVNAIDLIQDVLSQYTDLQSIQIVSHGSSGTIYLGKDELNKQTLSTYAHQLETIGSSLIESGDILIFGCDVAAGEDGAAFLKSMAHLTGADVTASTDVTGHAELHGNWVLEASYGSIEATNLFDEEKETLNWYNTLDSIAPTVTSFSPADGRTDVPLESYIFLNFSESIQRGTGTITLRTGSASGTIIESFDAATSSRLSILSGYILKIDPTSILVNSTHYYVVFPVGTVKDLDGNSYAGTSTYDFTTVDTTAPTVNGYTPADGATGVAVESNVVLSFSESIQKGTGTISLRSGSATGTVVENFDAASSSRVTVSGSTLTIDPTSALATDTQYYLVFASGTIKDLAGNSYAGTSAYDFTTIDTTAPTVTGFTPADGATGVAVDSNVVLSFSESIQKGAGTISLRSGSATGTVVENFDAASSSRVTVSSSTLTIDPTSNLSNNTHYYVTFASGTVKDPAGNSYAGTSTYDFTTIADTTAPTVTGFTPADGATGVAVGSNVVLSFSEAIQKGTGTISLRSGSATGTVVENFDAATSSRVTVSGSTLTIDPTNALVNSTQYFVTFASGTVKDLAGNSYPGTSAYDFTTIDTTAPTVTGYTPADGATGVAVGSNIVLSFSESIQKGTGTISLRSGSATGTVVENFDAASSSRVTVSGSTLTIDPTSNLSNNTHYYVTFANGTVKDLAGNSYLGTSTYDFTTIADTTAPTVTGYTPADGATGVALGSNIVLSFSESIQKGTGTILLRSGSATGTVVENFDTASSSRVTVSGSTLTIDPTSNLSNNTHYFVTFANGTVKDLAGNSYLGTSTYDFTTIVDTTAPTVTSFSPLAGSKDQSIAMNIVFVFNETIQKGTGTVEMHVGSATGSVVESFDAATSTRLTVSGAKLTIDPTAMMVNDTNYYVTVPHGSVQDLAGNPYEGTNSYHFTTVVAASTATASPMGSIGMALAGAAGLGLLAWVVL
jgi:methionine-rich copper-binding protein CopC